MVLLPFVIVTTGTGRALGWAAALAVIFARWSSFSTTANWLLVGAAWLAASAIGPDWYRGTPYHFGMAALAAVGITLMAIYRPERARGLLILAVIGSVAVLAWSVTHDPGGYLDVALMHREGANALRAGVSPWSGLEVPSGAPVDQGTVIAGNPYPPPTLLWYSVADWMTGDPRAGGALAWIVLAGAVSSLRWVDHRPAILILTSALPLMLWSGWTELFTVALLSLTMALWRRTTASSILLGSVLASKQYMITVAPLVFSRGWPLRRLGRYLPVATAAVMALTGFALGAGYLDAIIGVYGRFEARTDSASLFGLVSALGLELSIPAWLGPAAALMTALAIVVTRRVGGLSSFLAEGARCLAFLFLLGTQAFSNYWFLVWAMLALSLGLLDEPTGSPQDPTLGRARQ